MYKAPGLLDRRLKFYAARDSGGNGFARPVYDFTIERWGRVDATADVEAIPLAPQAHAEYRTDAVGMVADSTVVPLHGIVLDGAALYFVRGIVPVRQLRMQRLALEAIAPTAYAEFTLTDEPSTLDGEHLITP